MIEGIILIAIIALLLYLKKSPERQGFTFQIYKEKQFLLTPTELDFFNVLKKSVVNNETVFAKVRQADIVEVVQKSKNSGFWKAFNRISQRHVDFVLCDSKTSQPLIIIELNDKSHQKQDRMKRDMELRETINDTNIKLVEIPASSSYAVNEIQTAIYGNDVCCGDLKQNVTPQKETHFSILPSAIN